MKYLLFVVFASLLFLVGPVSPVHAFQGMNMDELHKQAESGDVEAQTKLGVAYARGTGVDMDKKLAVEWYTKAAEQGYANAQWNLAFMYIRAQGGIAEDYAAAAKLFTKAAEQEYPPAEYDLGMMYLQGMGVTRSRTSALDWITKSADHGYKEAEAFLTSRGVVRKGEKQEEKKE